MINILNIVKLFLMYFLSTTILYTPLSVTNFNSLSLRFCIYSTIFLQSSANFLLLSILKSISLSNVNMT